MSIGRRYETLDSLIDAYVTKLEAEGTASALQEDGVTDLREHVREFHVEHELADVVIEPHDIDFDIYYIPTFGYTECQD